MTAKAKPLGFALLCTLLLTEGVRAENCRVSVSQPRIDYGVIRREALVESPTVVLGTRTLQLNVLCAAPQAMALRFIGPGDGQGFRFGRHGRFNVTLKHARIDGRAVEWRLAHSPAEIAGGQLLPGQVLEARTQGKRLTAQVDIDTDLPASALQVHSQTLVEGQGRFELVSPTGPPG